MPSSVSYFQIFWIIVNVDVIRRLFLCTMAPARSPQFHSGFIAIIVFLMIKYCALLIVMICTKISASPFCTCSLVVVFFNLVHELVSAILHYDCVLYSMCLRRPACFLQHMYMYFLFLYMHEVLYFSFRVTCSTFSWLNHVQTHRVPQRTKIIALFPMLVYMHITFVMFMYAQCFIVCCTTCWFSPAHSSSASGLTTPHSFLGWCMHMYALYLLLCALYCPTCWLRSAHSSSASSFTTFFYNMLMYMHMYAQYLLLCELYCRTCWLRPAYSCNAPGITFFPLYLRGSAPAFVSIDWLHVVQ